MVSERAMNASLSRLTGCPIAKMNGAGNSIVVLDLRGRDLVVTGGEAQAIAASPGLLFDQLMVIHDPRDSGTGGHLRIYNVDGSEAGACGNGTRCVAWYLLHDADRDDLVLTTDAARLECQRLGPLRFSVDMGPPTFAYEAIPLRDGDPASLDFPPFGRAVAVGMGNPHAVFFVENVETLDLAAVGRPLEHAPVFPERANISFAQVIDQGAIRLRVWERGAGATLACGSGACATLVAAAATGRTGRHAAIDLPGGRLEITWRADDHVIMTGPAELEFLTTAGADGSERAA
jgi:diaminopimelate epimerase